MSETTTEKYIKKAITEAKKELSGTNITSCNFEGSKIIFDENIMGAISDIAEGCIENAKTLGKLAEVLKASNINVEPLLVFNNGSPE